MTDPSQTHPEPGRDPAVPATLGPTDPGATMNTLALTARETVRDATRLDVPGQLGRYRILGELGRGGMGTVYKALDTLLHREVALTVPHFGAGDTQALERFYTEARSAARLHHPNICTVFDVNEVDGVHHLSMACIEGEPLAARVKHYALRPARDAAALVRTIALALAEAHRQGIIHRDLKPQNIMLDRRGEPVVMDFGLAREIKAGDPTQTQQGAILGTPAYMAPEQAKGDVAAMGPGCDVYSLGVVLFELLAGSLPFRGSAMEIIAQHIHNEPPRPSLARPALDAHIETVCLKALAKEPSARFLSMAEFAQALDDYVAGRSLAGACPVTSDPFDCTIAQAIVLLRTWGWEAAVEKAREKIDAAQEGTHGARVDLLLRWLGGDAAAHAEALAEFAGLRQLPALAGWALLGRAFLANRDHHFGRAEELLREAAARGDPGDSILHASIAHQHGFRLYHAGRLEESLAALHEALDKCGRDHFLTSLVLGTLGLVYANKNNFLAAHEFYEQALRIKQRFANDWAVAAGLRGLGQLYLDWGYLDRAEDTFRQALQLSLACQDERGQANAFHYLGRVELIRGEREADGGHRAAARKHFTRSAEWLDASTAGHQAAGRPILEALALRDRAVLALAENDLAAAEQHARRAEALLTAAAHAEGIARLQQVWGVLARRREHFDESEKLLRAALAHFERTADYIEAARTQLEIARTLAEAHRPHQMIASAFLDALRRAEACRRTDLVRAVEEELKAVDEDAHWQHVFHRVRGRGITADTSSLTEGESEVTTALFLNLESFVPFCQGLDAEEVMRTINQLMADLGEVLERHRAFVTAYLGGGFMALVRGPGHAERAVGAGLELIAVVEAFNRPRAVLALRRLPVRIGIATGNMFLGNIGTYHKMDFTALGGAVNLASRLMRQGTNRSPCVSRETYDLVRDRFTFAEGNPRVADLTELGRREVWDVTGKG